MSAPTFGARRDKPARHATIIIGYGDQIGARIARAAQAISEALAEDELRDSDLDDVSGGLGMPALDAASKQRQP